MFYGVIPFWLGVGIRGGRELQTGVERVTIGNIFLFMIWGGSMLFEMFFVAVVS
jgi:hypothetical protein